jgi:hypothetical protein
MPPSPPNVVPMPPLHHVHKPSHQLHVIYLCLILQISSVTSSICSFVYTFETPTQMPPITFGHASHSISSCCVTQIQSTCIIPFVVYMIHMFINVYDFVAHVLTSSIISV